MLPWQPTRADLCWCWSARAVGIRGGSPWRPWLRLSGQVQVPPNYVLQRTPGTFYVSTNHRGPAPLNTALGGAEDTHAMFNLKSVALVLFVMFPLLGANRPLEACTRIMPISIEGMLKGTDVIVRAIAGEYELPAIGERFRHGFQLGTIRFTVVETLKGQATSGVVVLPGVLTERDDFNDHEPPSRFVRPEGRHGDCGATAYRRGAEFLLFLQQHDGRHRIFPEALGPVNEQLRGPEDAWRKWVKAMLNTQPASPPNTRVKPAGLNTEMPVVTQSRRGLRAGR
jgi:hypothetical protein